MVFGMFDGESFQKSIVQHITKSKCKFSYSKEEENGITWLEMCIVHTIRMKDANQEILKKKSAATNLKERRIRLRGKTAEEVVQSFSSLSDPKLLGASELLSYDIEKIIETFKVFFETQVEAFS